MFKIMSNDAPYSGQIGFQDPATPSFEGIIDLHNSMMFILMIIMTLVSWFLISILFKFGPNKIPHKYLIHGTLIEIMWTITPALILLTIAVPSFKLLYLMDEIIKPSLTIKVKGLQWYWSYQYPDYINDNNEIIEFDSYLVSEEDLELGEFRLLTVDEPVVLPVNTSISAIVTANDVMHDWAMPSLGIKIDAIPGSLNQSHILAMSEGMFVGQCSELCGVWHGFMPMVIEIVSIDQFLTWLNNKS